MICVKCSKHVGDCTCPDIKERLAAIATSPYVAVQFCKKCDEHHARCKCSEPEFEIRGGGL